jgi:hypothetical protein
LRLVVVTIAGAARPRSNYQIKAHTVPDRGSSDNPYSPDSAQQHNPAHRAAADALDAGVRILPQRSHSMHRDHLGNAANGLSMAYASVGSGSLPCDHQRRCGGVRPKLTPEPRACSAHMPGIHDPVKPRSGPKSAVRSGP